MDIDGKRICPKCLYKDMSDEEYHNMIGQHIEFLDAADRTEEQLYEARLDICRKCEKLNAGTCNSCGCYVEIRAAMKKGRCPIKKW